MPTRTEILNMAISHLGIGKEVANIVTEDTEEARAGRRFYDTAKDVVSTSIPWPFLTKIDTLGLVEEEPNTEWGYSYRYPSDCVFIERVLSGFRNDQLETRVPYKIARDASGILIFTDMDDAVIEYRVRADDPQFYPSDYTLALSYYLAMLMAPRLTKGDPNKLGIQAGQMYTLTVAAAQNRALNEPQDDKLPEADYVAGR